MSLMTSQQNLEDLSLDAMVASGALGFSSFGCTSAGDSVVLADQKVFTNDALSSYVRPTSTFGFPFEGKYAATGSRFIKASDIGITKPFVLEKCVLDFDSKFEFASSQFDTGSRAYSLALGKPNTGGNPSQRTLSENQKVYIPTFFILRQGVDKFNAEVDYEVEVTGSRFPRRRSVSIPDSRARLTSDNTDTGIQNVATTRELITYGQMTLFVSGTKRFRSYR
jgi:hypothetical protein